MRLIDADVLEKMWCEDCDNKHLCADSPACETVQQLYAMPTVDAEPVRHGHWIDVADFERCSVCNATTLKEFQTYYGKATWIKTPYCPYCGAKMDEKTAD